MKLKNVIYILFLFMATALFAQNSVPDWAKGAVWYQILPERFRNGNPNNDPIKERVVGNGVSDWQVHPWASDWYRLQIWETARGLDFYTLINDRRYGGDLLGVIEKLHYLNDLGIDVIVFTPIFEAPSHHKFDASTYHHIDNNFGYDRDGDWVSIQNEKEDSTTWSLTQADQVFLKLITQAHELGIRIVISGVFSHCGREFWAFKDVMENQQNSAYKDWFDIIGWDDPATPDTNEFNYKSWKGYKSFPEFKKDENGLVEPVKRYILDITRRWMDPNGDGDPSDGVDGWWLCDVKEINPKFWEAWYQLVKSINSDAYTVGDIWEIDTNWIKNKRFDAVMNYPLAKVMVDFFIDNQTKISVSDFDLQLERLRNLYSEDRNHILLNLIDSHDTDRVASMIKNPDRIYDHESGLRDNPEYDPRKPNKDQIKIQKFMAIFQMTYVGAPLIYYGDEAGMWGGDDPDNRKPMLWREFVYEKETYKTVRPDLKAEDENIFDRSLYNYYKKLMKIRHENPAIQYGNFMTRMVDNKRGLYAYSRKYNTNEIVVILNNSDDKQLFEFATLWENGTKVKDLLNEKPYQVKNGVIKMALDSKWGVILVKRK
ncbi:MAG: glycoside hydrolase family 13 protein [bacterium]